jgi:hypothetical protein
MVVANKEATEPRVSLSRHHALVDCDGISVSQMTSEEFEDAKGVIRIRILKKNRQHNDQKKKSTKGKATIYKTYI